MFSQIDSDPTWVTPFGSKPFARSVWVSSTDSRECSVFVPPTAHEHSPLVLAFHGVNNDHHMMEGGHAAYFMDEAHDRGWVVYAPFTGNNWGDASIMRQAGEVVAWARESRPYTRIIAYGYSMGGMAVYNLIPHNPFWGMICGITINGVVDEQVMRGRYTPGYDPARDAPARYAGMPLYMSAGTADVHVEKAKHADVFYTRAATPELITYYEGTHNHFGGFQNPEVSIWAGAIVDATPLEGPPGGPGPDPDPDPDPGPGAGSGLYRTGGEGVTLYRTDGTRVPSLAR